MQNEERFGHCPVVLLAELGPYLVKRHMIGVVVSRRPAVLECRDGVLDDFVKNLRWDRLVVRPCGPQKHSLESGGSKNFSSSVDIAVDGLAVFRKVL